tara:strand:+ start:217 stop:387 length:171 start_codon:yes stop_codon:yes gene_type:complete
MGSKLSKLNKNPNKADVTPVPTSYEDDINETTYITPSIQPNIKSKKPSKLKKKILV